VTFTHISLIISHITESVKNQIKKEFENLPLLFKGRKPLFVCSQAHGNSKPKPSGAVCVGARDKPSRSTTRTTATAHGFLPLPFCPYVYFCFLFARTKFKPHIKISMSNIQKKLAKNVGKITFV